MQSSLAAVPWAKLYSRLDASELSATNELPQPPKGTPVPVMFPPTPKSKPSSGPRASGVKTARRSSPRPSPLRSAPRQPGWERWLETPVIQLSHIVVLVVSGTMFGVGLSAFALEFLGTLPGLEFLKL